MDNTNLESMKKKLIDYAEKKNYGKVLIDTIKECESENRLRMCLEILEEKGEISWTAITYALLTD